ncbi:MAG TPA: excinuclease ABC subunit UvrA, partial [Casimicrobium sp.]|nr:excinuclease ABC subunit UvrA [Casimicrobium sp.]
MDFLRVRGARTHNLKNINIDIPKHKLVVITGLSGSGKSSLAFDTLYAEGQRRYVESLSAYARQFLQMMDKPDVDLIEGLAPAIAIEQKATSHNPRSTVGTVTEIHDYLRLLYARVGDPYCPNHPEIMLSSQTISQMVDSVLAYPPETRVMLLAPVLTDRKGEHIELFIELKAKGFTRVRINGEVTELEPTPKLHKNHKHTIEVVVDRIKVRPDAKQRLAESFETACRLGNGRAFVVKMDASEDKPESNLFSTKFACPICDYSLSELEPRLFSFNSPMGACPSCDGLGEIDEFEPTRIVAHPELSLASGAIKGWDRRTIFYFQMLQGLAAHYGFNIEQPFGELPEEARNAVVFGSGEDIIEFDYVSEKGVIQKRKHPFEGVLPNFRRRYLETESSAVREELSKYMSRRPCPDCEGARLRREARFVMVGGVPIYAVSALALFETAKFFENLKLTGAKQKIAERIVWEIRNRVGFLNNVGLDYLSLDRSAETLSGGEAQRIRLASQIGSGLTGVMYVLDEPSIGLHQRDNDRLLETLKHLRDLGNTVIVVEHDEDAIMSADYVIDLGPAAGIHGGEIIAHGKPADIKKSKTSLTGLYLSGAMQIALPKKRIAPDADKQITIRGARGNNLKNVDVSIPVGLLTCVTGVSGSGKSTLVNDTLYCAAAKKIYGSLQEPAPHAGIDGLNA